MAGFLQHFPQIKCKHLFCINMRFISQNGQQQKAPNRCPVNTVAISNTIFHSKFSVPIQQHCFRTLDLNRHGIFLLNSIGIAKRVDHQSPVNHSVISEKDSSRQNLRKQVGKDATTRDWRLDSPTHAQFHTNTNPSADYGQI